MASGFELSSEFWAAIVGAVVGSGLGGIVSYVLQRSAISEARTDRQTQERKEQRATGYSLAFNALTITNHLANLRKHVGDCVGRSKGNQLDNPFTFLQPLANPPRSIEFTPSEMSLLLSLGNNDLFNGVRTLELFYNSILPVWTRYGLERESFHGSHIKSVDGPDEATLAIPRESALQFMQVDALAREIIRRSDEDYVEASELLARLLPFLAKELGISLSADAPLAFEPLPPGLSGPAR